MMKATLYMYMYISRSEPIFKPDPHVKYRYI